MYGEKRRLKAGWQQYDVHYTHPDSKVSYISPAVFSDQQFEDSGCSTRDEFAIEVSLQHTGSKWFYARGYRVTKTVRMANAAYYAAERAHAQDGDRTTRHDPDFPPLQRDPPVIGPDGCYTYLTEKARNETHPRNT